MPASSPPENDPSETIATLRDVGEFGLIERVTAGRRQPAGTLLGPGDDAAVVAAPDGRVVASTDVLVDTVHFRLDWSSPEQVGRKAAAANLADVAAMGAVPTALLVGLACPAVTPVATLTGLADGLWAEATAVGIGLVGGDVVAAGSLVLSVTALGSLEGRAPVTRAGAGRVTWWRCAVGSGGRRPASPCCSGGSARPRRWSVPTGSRSRPTPPGRRPRWAGPPP